MVSGDKVGDMRPMSPAPTVWCPLIGLHLTYVCDIVGEIGLCHQHLQCCAPPFSPSFDSISTPIQTNGQDKIDKKRKEFNKHNIISITLKCFQESQKNFHKI